MGCSSFLVYKAENRENGFVYVGATKNSVVERKKDHELKASKGQGYKFHEAIGTYGPEAFSWEQIDTASSTDELAQKEKRYVVEYNSKEEGYNSDSGGGFKKTVYQYSVKDGGLINTFDCLESAADAVNSTRKGVSKACLGVSRICKGYYWSYEYKDSFIPSEDNRMKRVMYINLKDKSTAKFDSVIEASKITNVNKSSIAKVCRGERKTAGGFKWSYI